jgi:hypothetical protein
MDRTESRLAFRLRFARAWESFMHPELRLPALERESDASEADNHVTLGLGEGAVYGRNATGTRREFLSAPSRL